ncbi:MAG: hypothetical protein ACYCPN_01675 [Thermoplasmata archaeon]
MTGRAFHPNEPFSTGRANLMFPVLGILLVAIIVVVSLEVGSYMAAVPSGTSSLPQSATYVNLTIHYSPTTGNSWYAPGNSPTPVGSWSGNLSVPAQSRVVFVITNYDPTTNELLAPRDNCVAGTLGGVESVQAGSSPPESPVSCLPATDISHTFTMFDSAYNLNVPIPPAPNNRTPVTVTFSVTFGSLGTYQWGCMCRCGLMIVPGMMYGNLTVT